MAATAKRTGAMAAAALLFGLATSAQAASLSLEAGPRHLARLDEARWQLVEEAVFSCRLEHSVPVLGRAVFETRAGGKIGRASCREREESRVEGGAVEKDDE